MIFWKVVYLEDWNVKEKRDKKMILFILFFNKYI